MVVVCWFGWQGYTSISIYAIDHEVVARYYRL
jgi:hypothetical protein